MTDIRFQIIHLGNPYDFVVKDHNTNRTYGTFQGDEKQMERLLNDLNEEIVELKKDNLEAFGLLGTVRAYIRTGDTEEAIRKINKFEKEQLQ